jgi:putative acetyltransferase
VDDDPNSVTVRVMEPDEFDAMRDVAVDAFEGEPAIGPLLGSLRESPSWIPELSFVAELDGEIVGQVLFTRGWVDALRALVDVVVLSPVGVRPDLQRRGVGAALIEHALAVIEDRQEPLVFLEGHPSYYPRFGFRPAGQLGFTSPSVRTPPAAFMVRPTAKWDESWQTGTLVYADAFWRHDTVGLRGDV